MSDQPVTIIGADVVREYMRDIPNKLFEGARVAFSSTAQKASNEVKRNISDGAGDTLHSRTGQLRRSIRFKVYGGNIDTLGASVYSEKSIASYAPTHEQGKTIRAVKAYRRLPGGPYLHFPIGENLTPAGVQRMSGRDVFQRGAYVAKNRNLAFPYRVVLDGEAMFLLTKQSVIPARLQMVSTVEGEIPTLLSNLRGVTQEAID